MADQPPVIAPPRAVLDIARRLEDAGYPTWCVGGAVRDALLGHAHLDWDLATAATPPQVRALFRRTVPKGIAFGTVGVLDSAGAMHEVTTFRRDVRTDGRHAEVEFGGSLDEDLARRDFTINAIAYSPRTGEIRDPFGGRDDLRRRVVRAVGDPAARLREDWLRALRAIRFAARLEFAVDPATWDAIVASAPNLDRLSRERVQEELRKTLVQVARPSRALRLWRDSGALRVLIPPLAGVADRTLAMVDAVAQPGAVRRPQRVIIRMAALFSELTPALAERTLRELRIANREAAWIAALLEGWGAVAGELRSALASGAPVDDARIRRWVSRAGRLYIAPVLRLEGAHASAACSELDAAPPRRSDGARLRSLYRRAMRIAFHEPVELADLAVDGSDLRAAGIAPGPELGRTLRVLLDEVVEDPARNHREWLLARARSLAGTDA